MAMLNVQAGCMPWIRKLNEPFALKDGRILVAVADAHRMMVALPEARLRSFHWRRPHELLNKAANSGAPSAFAQALAQVPRPPRSESLL
jgi:hypothetical protein